MNHNISRALAVLGGYLILMPIYYIKEVPVWMIVFIWINMAFMFILYFTDYHKPKRRSNK